MTLKRWRTIVVVGLLCGVGHRVARAEPPACFPERTVLWAARFLDEHGNAFGGIRAGHTVRVIDDFVGADGEQALIEVDEPLRVRALVPRRMLVAFTRHETELIPGFSRWVAGAPVMLGKLEGGEPRLSLADHHVSLREPSTVAPCAAVTGVPAEIGHRDRCGGASPVTDAVTHGTQRVFWETDVPLRALLGKGQVTIPANEWVHLVEKRKDDVIVEYRDWPGHTMYLGKVARRGMEVVPGDVERGWDTCVVRAFSCSIQAST